MPALSRAAKNRLGFVVLGLTNNFAYVIMLSAAVDLLKLASSPASPTKYCNEHSTSTILLADTIPSLTTKLIYPFLLVGVPTPYKAAMTALFSAAAFIITGLTDNSILIFGGVICASFASGLGEVTYLSNTPLYGDFALSGWSIGTGLAGVLGSVAYATLKIFMSTSSIMMTMLVAPLCMIIAYFVVIEADEVGPVVEPRNDPNTARMNVMPAEVATVQTSHQLTPTLAESQMRNYGANDATPSRTTSLADGQLITDSTGSLAFDLRAKLHYLPSLAKYFLPLTLVYFGEYFINQGLFELIYYPEISYLDKAAQYRWFQVSYQVGVLISRSSIELLTIKNIWSMSLLQLANAILFTLHASKVIHIPNFYIVIVLIIYEGLLGGFTYVNTFDRVKREVPPSRREFGISVVTTGDSVGIVLAGLAALPVHDALCKLYQ